MLVAVMLNASSNNRRSIKDEKHAAQQLCSVCLDYDDTRLLPAELQLASIGKRNLNEAAYRVLRHIAESQRSISRSTFMVRLIDGEVTRENDR